MADTTQFANMHSAALSQNSRDPHYGLPNFGPPPTTFDMPEGSSFTAAAVGDPQYALQVRRPSQSDVTGSPSSSYAQSLSDGRNSISYGVAPSFKMPAAVGMDRRTSSPIVNARNPQLLGDAVYQQSLSSRNNMHASHWTPNFSFGNPTQRDDTAPQSSETYSNQALAMKQPFLDHRRGSQGFRVAPNEVSAQYNVDRRMSHPVLSSSGTFDILPQSARHRQVSAVDWHSFNAANSVLRPGAAESTMEGFHGIDILWNTIDSARGMAAMSQQTAESAMSQFRANSTARRQSQTFMPGTIAEDVDQLDGGGLFPERHMSGSEESVILQPSQGPQADQASMMTTFSANDSKIGHKKHICGVCNKRFTRPSSLTTHTYSHTGEKPFLCDVDGCGRHFSVISNLRRHRKIHSQSDQSPTHDTEY